MTTVRYQLSNSEAVDALLEVRRLNHPQEMIKSTAASLLGAALIVAVYVHRDGGRRPEMAVVGFGLVVCLTPLFYLAARLRVRRAVARRVRSNPQITSPEELSFGDAGLTLATNSQRQEFSWTVFPGRRQDERYFYLFSGAGGVYAVVPKRAFDAPGLVEFVRLGKFSSPP